VTCPGFAFAAATKVRTESKGVFGPVTAISGSSATKPTGAKSRSGS
jgi:hypothetical protein